MYENTLQSAPLLSLLNAGADCGCINMTPPPPSHGDAAQLAAAEPFAKGTWFYTGPASSAIRCVEYTAPPPPAGHGGIRVSIIPPEVSIGPVHKSTADGRIDGDRFYSVLVPSQMDRDLLVWVNVKRETQWFAEEVPQHVLQSWRRRGWEDLIPTSLTPPSGPT